MTERNQQERGDDELLDHEYDGIREYDNPLPRWWVWIFWGSFYFAVLYVLWFHVFPHGMSIEDAYAKDMAEFRERIAMQEMGSEITEDSLAKLAANDTVMADAAKIFQAKCVQCHDTKGQGKIGPNLTDSYWIHGKGTLMDIHTVVSNGVAAKGMPAWNRQLRPIELSKVVAYVGTLRNTNVPGKAPEGTPVTGAAGETPAAAKVAEDATHTAAVPAPTDGQGSPASGSGAPSAAPPDQGTPGVASDAPAGAEASDVPKAGGSEPAGAVAPAPEAAAREGEGEKGG